VLVADRVSRVPDIPESARGIDRSRRYVLAVGNRCCDPQSDHDSICADAHGSPRSCLQPGSQPTAARGRDCCHSDRLAPAWPAVRSDEDGYRVDKRPVHDRFYRARVPAMEAFGLFTGSILAMTETETWAILVVGTVVLTVFVALYREIQLVLYDRELAKMLGVPAEAIRNGLLVLTGLAIGLAMRIVGALLVDAVMLLPALGAMMIGKSLAQVLFVCSVLGILSASGGLMLSMAVDLPSGASMTAVAVVALMVVATIRSILEQRRGVRGE
jgi:hypothetical protein